MHSQKGVCVPAPRRFAGSADGCPTRLRSTNRWRTSTAGAVAPIVVAQILAGPAISATIPPDQLFFPPASLVEDHNPRKGFTGDGELSPFTLTWTVADILSRDPGRVDISLDGIQILPVLNPNPDPASVEGEYTDADLAAITVANYATYYGFTPGFTILAPGVHYSADLTANVITVQIIASGPWTFRVLTTSRPFPGGPLEPVEYLYTNLLGDEYALPPGSDPVPARVHRKMDLDTLFEGVAGPPGTVHVVSERTAGDNGFLANTNELLTDQGKDPQMASNVADLVTEICEAATANGGPVVAKIYAHGNGPAGYGGPGAFEVGTEWVGCVANAPKKAAKLGECLKGKVSEIIIVSCYVGSDGAFLQDMANAAGVTVRGWDVEVTCAKKSTFWGITTSDGYFNTNAKGTKKKAVPAGCSTPGCAADLNFNTEVGGDDLGLLLADWGGAGCGDIDGNGVVDGADLGGLLAGWGPCPSDAPPSCGIGAGPCCEPHGGAGCESDACCATVCELDLFCCDIQWDELCASEAIGLINCQCPQPEPCLVSDNDCCQSALTPGCGDESCCFGVCSLDEYCCEVAWDGLCVQEAQQHCGDLCPSIIGPPNDFCAEPLPIGLGTTPFSTIGASTDGQPLPPFCDQGFGLEIVNDIWFMFVAPQGGILMVSTCNQADYDTRLAAYQACGGPAMACNDDFPGCAEFTSLMQVPTFPGQPILIRVGGYDGSGGGVLTLSY